ncbi:type II secretion system pilot lipoprotein GspS-beta [Enterobacter kobei]|uniref:type II secretion system pilot lipoprotein GspS-beta n=1 Tax=Enterobacter kobei TaxID=208224 RepID=UPI003CF7EA8A
MKIKHFITTFLPVSFCLLSGCSTAEKPQPDPVSQMQEYQAREINQGLPVTVSNISLVHARAEGRTLVLSLYPDSSHKTSEYYMKEYARQLCQQPEIIQHVASGGLYRLEWTGGGENREPVTIAHC